MNEGIDRLVVYLVSTIILTIAVSSVLIHLSNFRTSEDSIRSRLMRVWRDKKTPYYIWFVLLLGALLFQGGYGGLPRFASPLFPILWSNAIWIDKRPLWAYSLLLLYICLMISGTALFVNWYFFL